MNDGDTPLKSLKSPSSVIVPPSSSITSLPFCTASVPSVVTLAGNLLSVNVPFCPTSPSTVVEDVG